jgi:hypothetical protein
VSQWINCPLCGSTETCRVREGDEGQGLNYCTNLECPSNSAEPVATHSELQVKVWKLEAEVKVLQSRPLWADLNQAWAARHDSERETAALRQVVRDHWAPSQAEKILAAARERGEE